MSTLRAVIAGAVAIGLWAPGAWGQSLGDVAKKESERRKKNQEAGVKPRTFGQEDLAGGTGSVANDPVAAPAKPASEPGATRPAGSSRPDAASNRAAEEMMWRDRYAAAKGRLQAAQEYYDFLNGHHLAPGEWFEDRRGRTVIRDAEQLQAMVARARNERVAAQKALDDLLEAARRANVPPGWVR